MRRGRRCRAREVVAGASAHEDRRAEASRAGNSSGWARFRAAPADFLADLTVRLHLSAPQWCGDLYKRRPTCEVTRLATEFLSRSTVPARSGWWMNITR